MDNIHIIGYNLGKMINKLRAYFTNNTTNEGIFITYKYNQLAKGKNLTGFYSIMDTLKFSRSVLSENQYNELLNEIL